MNWKDLGYKVLWTAVSAGLGVALTAAAEWDYVWAPVAIAAINAALAFIRQQLGATPPEAPAVNALSPSHAEDPQP